MVVTSRGHYQCRWEEAWGAARHFAVRGAAPRRGRSSPACRERGRRDMQPGDESQAGQRPGDAGLNRTSSRGHRGRRTCGEHGKGPHGSSAGRPHARPRAASPGTSRVVQTGWPGPRAWSSGPRRPRASRGPGVPRAPLRPSAPCSLSHLTLAVIPVREVLAPVDSGCLGRPQRGSSSPVVRHGVAGLGPVSAARPSGPAAPSDSQDS